MSFCRILVAIQQRLTSVINFPFWSTAISLLAAGLMSGSSTEKGETEYWREGHEDSALLSFSALTQMEAILQPCRIAIKHLYHFVLSHDGTFPIFHAQERWYANIYSNSHPSLCLFPKRTRLPNSGPCSFQWSWNLALLCLDSTCASYLGGCVSLHSNTQHIFPFILSYAYLVLLCLCALPGLPPGKSISTSLWLLNFVIFYKTIAPTVKWLHGSSGCRLKRGADMQLFWLWKKLVKVVLQWIIRNKMKRHTLSCLVAWFLCQLNDFLGGAQPRFLFWYSFVCTCTFSAVFIKVHMHLV